MEKYREWEGNPGEKLDIPGILLKKLKYKAVYGPAGALSTAWCGQAILGRNDVELRDVLVDTSDRAQGILLRKRLTYWRKIVLVSTPVMILDLGVQEVVKLGN